MAEVVVCYCVHDDSYYLAESIASFREAGPIFVFVSRVPWHDQPGDWEAAAEVARTAGAVVVLGDWTSELTHRQGAFAWLVEKGYTHALIPDGDEIIEPRLLDTLRKLAEHDLAERVYVHWDTYWKSPEYVIRPREAFTPLLLVDFRQAQPVQNRHFEGGRSLLLSPDYGLVHHLSYVGPDSRIRRKLSTWGHRNEVVPGWYEQVWNAWDTNKMLRHLHPTHPHAYEWAERIPVPPILLPTFARYRELGGVSPTSSDVDLARTPTVSVVIPLCGGEEDIYACLQSLSACGDLISETIIVDNASPDRAAEVASEFDGVRLLRNETNTGFAAACNRGLAESKGEIVLFLNSDTIVPRIGLMRLLQALLQSGSIAAAGPWTNRAGHDQQITPTYTDLAHIDFFAEDFAERDADDEETDMLVGFCLAVRRSVLDEIGGFDTRFGLGTFEDNDLCYRMRRAGYRLVRAARSFVHHGGSKTFARLATGSVDVSPMSGPSKFDVGTLLHTNERLYRAKWQEDLDSGFASHLSGLSAEPIVFTQANHPDQRARKRKELARRADISLCMIVKNEERVLADCLRSARPFFTQVIVVDTGSTDRTREIAREYGAQVIDFPWPDSFAIARTESLRHATGRWIFWLDADDTLPAATGEALLNAALHAAPQVTGFVVPVQFVENGLPSGTRVDHVKLFRNLPGLAFEGRIHEQILPALRARGGDIVRLPAAPASHPSPEGKPTETPVVLHSGYDVSPAGQARKRERDAKLLALDLADRPDHPFVLFNLGMTDHYGHAHEGAVTWLRRCLEVSNPTDSQVRKAYALLALSLRELGRETEAKETLEMGLEVTPDDPELHFHLGHLLSALGDHAKAKDHYLRTLQANPDDHFSSLDTGILGFKTYHNLGSVCALLQDYPETRRWWFKALEASPASFPTLLSLFEAALSARDYATARQMVEQAAALQGRSEAWADLAVRCEEAQGGPQAADRFLRQIVQEQPNALGPRLVLARRLLQCEQIGEAKEHLLVLSACGVAEAAFFLGIIEIRNGNLREALRWTEQAYTLNPAHVETLEQIRHLKEALGEQSSKVQSIPLDEALTQIAADFDLDAASLIAYAGEDTIGGYGSPEKEGALHWPGGSVWEGEGRVLYALIRALQPETIVEVGSLVGCSTAHMALACIRNGKGQIYAVDPYADFSRLSADLLTVIEPVLTDVFTWTPPASIDFLFEDGAHTPGFTGSVLQHLQPSLQIGATVLCHDYHQRELGAHISVEFREVLGETAHSVLVTPSDCGLGYARYQEEVPQ